MKNKKRKTKVTLALNSMNKNDFYSLMLFVLYKLREIPDYLAISELAYILDSDNLAKFLSYYGGMTITVPTLRDLRLLTKALLLYQYVNLEGGAFEEGLKGILDDEFTADDLKKTYSKILEVTADYDFDSRSES